MNDLLLAACCVIRHAHSTGEAWELMDMLGLASERQPDDFIPVGTCKDCGYAKSGQNHRTLCGGAA